VSSSNPQAIEKPLVLLRLTRAAVRVRLGQQFVVAIGPKLSHEKSRLNSIRYLLCGVADTREVPASTARTSRAVADRFSLYQCRSTRRVKDWQSVSNFLRSNEQEPVPTEAGARVLACLRSRLRLRSPEGFRDRLPPNGSSRENPWAVSSG